MPSKPRGKRRSKRPRRRWEDNIQNRLKEIDVNTKKLDRLCSGHGLFKRALVNAALYFKVP